MSEAPEQGEAVAQMANDSSQIEETQTTQDGTMLEDETELDTAAPAEVSGDEGLNENQTLAKLRTEADANYDKYLRAVAELENFKKRALKERSDLLKYTGENVIFDLLEVVDNLERALSHKDTNSVDELVKGIEMIRNQFVSILDKHSVRAKACRGEKFDPNMHQAMASVPSEAEAPGTILEEYRKAYMYKDKLIRPAQVVVSIAKENTTNATEKTAGENGGK
ncbi:nucleotide exchange factor GrpE [bacterium]|nr:nucleotide exchange factor GrpE [bacterium]